MKNLVLSCILVSLPGVFLQWMVCAGMIALPTGPVVGLVDSPSDAVGQLHDSHH